MTNMMTQASKYTQTNKHNTSKSSASTATTVTVDSNNKHDVSSDEVHFDATQTTTAVNMTTATTHMHFGRTSASTQIRC